MATVGGSIVADAVDFFKSFEGVEEGFRTRGDQIHEILRSSDTSVIVVASPTGRSLRNAQGFIGQLREAGITPSLTIVNRCTPEVPTAEPSSAAANIVRHLHLRRMAEQENLAEHADVDSLPLVSLTDLASPVTSLDGIAELAEQLR